MTDADAPSPAGGGAPTNTLTAPALPHAGGGSTLADLLVFSDAERVADRPEVRVRIDRLDHLVLTVADIDRTVAFYRDVLGMQPVVFGGGRTALAFGRSKINLHEAGREFEPKAARPVPGSADVCLVVDEPLDAVLGELAAHGVPVEEGPVDRTGATGAIRSIYVRDPDGNLVELSNYR